MRTCVYMYMRAHAWWWRWWWAEGDGRWWWVFWGDKGPTALLRLLTCATAYEQARGIDAGVVDFDAPLLALRDHIHAVGAE